jgi:hypothetical protein
VRSDVAIHRCASPERDAPTPSEPCRLLHEEAAGFSCRRRARTDLSITTGITAPAGSPKKGGAPPGGRLSILDRPPGRHAHPAERQSRPLRARRRRTAHHRLRTASHRPEGQVFTRTTRPSTSTTREPSRQPQVIDTGRPALGRAATALGSTPFRRHPDEQFGAKEAGSDAFAY